MRKEEIEIYSDASNRAVLRHPGRNFPGVLVQGDTLHNICQRLDFALKTLEPASEAYKELSEVCSALNSLKNHYKVTLADHGIPLPFSDD